MIVSLLLLGCTVFAQIDPNGARGLTSITPPEDTADTTGETGDTADTSSDPDTDEPVDTGLPEDTDVPEDTGPDFVPDGMTCYALAPRGTSVALVAVDMDTAVVTDVMTWSGLGTGSSFHTYGMTRDATGWAAIGYGSGSFSGFSFYHFDLDGTASVGANADVMSIAWIGTSYLVADPDYETLRACGTWADVQSGSCPLYGALPAGNERFATDGVELYGAWHSTADINVYDLGSTAKKRIILLEDWDTWVRGMSVVGGSLFLIDDGRQYAHQRIVEFDAMTGRIRNQVFLPVVPFSMPSGLWCSDAPL